MRPKGWVIFPILLQHMGVPPGFGPPWEPVGTENQARPHHQDGAHQPHADSTANALRSGRFGELEVWWEVDGLIRGDRVEVPDERNERQDGSQQDQQTAGDETPADRGDLPHTKVGVPHGVTTSSVPTEPHQQRQQHEDLTCCDLWRGEALSQADGPAVHGFEPLADVGVAVKARPPDPHPGHTRSDDVTFRNLPHPPLDESGSHRRQRPANQSQQEGGQLGVGCVGQVGHSRRRPRKSSNSRRSEPRLS